MANDKTMYTPQEIAVIKIEVPDTLKFPLLLISSTFPKSINITNIRSINNEMPKTVLTNLVLFL